MAEVEFIRWSNLIYNLDTVYIVVNVSFSSYNSSIQLNKDVSNYIEIYSESDLCVESYLSL